MKLRRSSNEQQNAAGDARYDTATAPMTNDATAALAMQATDVQNARFHTARKGYHKGEVDDFLDRVEAAIEAKNARIAELEAQTATAPAAAVPSAAPAAAPEPVSAVPVSAPAVAAAPAETYPEQQVAQNAAPQANAAFGVPDALSAAVPEQQPAAAPAAPAASAASPAAGQTAGGDGAGSFAAGWYADPWNQATYRYYDGSDWTAQTR